MKHELRLFLIALQFFTRIPVPSWVGWQAQWLNASARYFPLVGMLVGSVGAVSLALAAQVWPWPVAVLLSMAATIVLTGAFHEDGFADTCDGLGGAVSRERALEIMKDSRLGTYGVTGLGLMLLLKGATLTQMSLGTACLALPLAHCVSRAVAVCLIRWLPYAGDPDHSKIKPMPGHMTRAGWLVAMAWTALLLAGCAWLTPDLGGAPGGLAGAARLGLAGAAAALVLWRAGVLFRRRLGGVTGDCLGAAQQASELAFYLGLLATA